jgi:hypothetical protein
LVAQDPTADDHSEPDGSAEGSDTLATQVTEEVERARGQVFAHYVRARERARLLGALDDADTQ